MKRKSFPVRDKGHCFIHLVPYSEHSSYSELREYVQFLHPHKVCSFACSINTTEPSYVSARTILNLHMVNQSCCDM